MGHKPNYQNTKYSNQYQDNIEEEEFEQETENNATEENLDYKSSDSNERQLEKPTLDKLFDVKVYLKSLEKQFKGFIERDNRWEKISPELARDVFIDNMVINGLRAIITEHNIYSYLSEEDAETILREENIKFIKSVLNERTVETPTELRLMVEIYDHALQTFMGLPTKGHGSVVLRDVSGGLSQGNSHLTPAQKAGFFSELNNIFSFNKGGNK